jgi:histidyl-tRNA synthetase
MPFSHRMPSTPEEMELTRGSYILEIVLKRSLKVSIRGRSHVLPIGTYAYCGSAKGPGGIRARVARHSRMGKKPHWHVDQVTSVVGVEHAWFSETLSECELVSLLKDQTTTIVPAPGFGSSDCRVCPAHFMQVPESFDFSILGQRSIPLNC